MLHGMRTLSPTFTFDTLSEPGFIVGHENGASSRGQAPVHVRVGTTDVRPGRPDGAIVRSRICSPLTLNAFW